MEQLFTLTKMVAALVGMSLLVLGGQYATGKVRGIRVGDDQPVMTGAAPTVGETGDTTAGSTGERDFTIDSFEECAQAGFPVLQTYPPICRTPDGRTFVEVSTFLSLRRLPPESRILAPGRVASTLTTRISVL